MLQLKSDGRLQGVKSPGDAQIQLAKFYNRRIEARIVRDDGIVVGRVYKMDGRWNYYLDQDLAKGAV